MDTDNVYVVDSDGKLAKVTFDVVEIDWKFDFEYNGWVDYGPLPEGTNGEYEEETDDGSEEISGRVSDTDGTGGSDSGDQEDGASWGVVPGEAEGRGEPS